MSLWNCVNTDGAHKPPSVRYREKQRQKAYVRGLIESIFVSNIITDIGQNAVTHSPHKVIRKARSLFTFWNEQTMRLVAGADVWMQPVLLKVIIGVMRCQTPV